MGYAADVMDSLVPITQFNKGQASRIFERVKTERQLFVLKNNAPAAVILSPEEYRRLTEVEEDFYLYQLAMDRMQGDWESRTIPFEKLLEEFGLSEADLDDVEVELE